MALSRNGRLLATGSVDRTVRLWGLPHGKRLARSVPRSIGRMFSEPFHQTSWFPGAITFVPGSLSSQCRSGTPLKAWSAETRASTR